MMDNQCANIFSTHNVKCLHLLKDRIFFFMCILNLGFLSLVCVSFFSPPPKLSPTLFFPTLVLCFLFIQGEKLVFNICCSQGELSLFSIELFCLVFPFFSIFSYLQLRIYFFFNLGKNALSLSICVKKGEIQMKCENMWESCLFCLGGVEIVFENGRI